VTRATCEGCQSLDIRQLHRKGLLRPGLWLPWSWTRNDEPAGTINIETEHDALVLTYRSRRFGSTEWRAVRQRVPITWTECHLGGRRPWFRCTGLSNGRHCERRVAIIYNAGDVFACRHCCGLCYGSQQEPVRERGILTARKIRMRLGGGPNITRPFPDRPKRMHRRTYDRLRRVHDQAYARLQIRMAGMRFRRGEAPEGAAASSNAWVSLLHALSDRSVRWPRPP
jgi:hypothetical protein